MGYNCEAPRFEQFETESEIIIPIGFIPEVAEFASPYLRSCSKSNPEIQVEKYLQPGNLFECKSKGGNQQYRVLVLTHILHGDGVDVLLVVDEKLPRKIKRSIHLHAHRDPKRGETNYSQTIDPKNDFLAKAAEIICKELSLDNLYGL